jgi:hypothetical protein
MSEASKKHWLQFCHLDLQKAEQDLADIDITFDAENDRHRTELEKINSARALKRIEIERCKSSVTLAEDEMERGFE